VSQAERQSLELSWEAGQISLFPDQRKRTPRDFRWVVKVGVTAFCGAQPLTPALSFPGLDLGVKGKGRDGDWPLPRRGNPKGPRLLPLDTPPLLVGQARVTGEKRGKLAGPVTFGEKTRNAANLGRVLWLSCGRRNRPKRWLDFGDDDGPFCRNLQTGLERPDPCMVDPTRIVAQCASYRDPGQRLAAD
jgi:hypothetical protein